MTTDDVEARLDAWGRRAPDRADAGAFLDEVGRVRARRQARTAGVGLAAVVLATAGLWALLPGGGAEDGGGGGKVERGPGLIANDDARTGTDEAHGMNGSAWTLAALSRRIAAWDGEPGGLLPGGWSMGWASEPPF